MTVLYHLSDITIIFPIMRHNQQKFIIKKNKIQGNFISVQPLWCQNERKENHIEKTKGKIIGLN